MPPAGSTTQTLLTTVEPVIKLQKPVVKEYHEPEEHVFEEIPFLTALAAYLNLALLVLAGYIRDFMRLWGYENTLAAKEYGNEVQFDMKYIAT